MKIAAFVMSHSHNGNCATAAKQLLAGAEACGAETEIYYLLDYDIKPCRGCRACETTNQCVIKGDDMPILTQALIDCDAYVLATPTFYGDIPGAFKTFVDRVYPFVEIGKDPVTKSMTFGSNMKVRKPGISITVSGNHGPKVFDSHLKVCYFCFNDINAYPWKELLITKTSWKAVKEQESTMEALYQTGCDVVDHLKNGEKEDPERTKTFYNHFRLLEDVELPSYENIFPKETN